MLFKKYLPLIGMLLLPAAAWAEDASAVQHGDTAMMLFSTALVLIMTPGLAFFYAGMVRAKNAVSTAFQNFVALGVVGVLWIVIGYSLAFSGGNGFIGDTAFMMFEGVGLQPSEGSTIPHVVFAMFQMMFAIITPALITGAFAERINFKAWLIFMPLWSILVYSPVAHWVWAGSGWLFERGAQDFAGGLVVHMTAGFSALVAAIVLGKRKDFGQAIKPYNVGMVLLGTSLLWFGWFGFNAGSALSSGEAASQAFTTTFLSSAAAMLTWILVDTMKDGKPTLMGACIAVVAGLIAVTPAAGYVSVGSSLIIGLCAGVLCNFAARIVKGVFKIDDSLDVFACHGVGGTFGVLMTGLLASSAIYPAGKDGLLMGNGSELFMTNLTGIVAVAVYSMVVTFIILKVVGAVTPLRVSSADENAGLDSSQHDEKIVNV